MYKNDLLQKIFKNPLFSMVLLLTIAIVGIVFLNWKTENQAARIAQYRKVLEANLDNNVEQVECYREVYGHKNEYVRYDCNYISKNYKNVGVVVVDESELAPPFRVVSRFHQLEVVTFVKNENTGSGYLTFEYNNFSSTNVDMLSQADAYYQENLVKAIIRNKVGLVATR